MGASEAASSATNRPLGSPIGGRARCTAEGRRGGGVGAVRRGFTLLDVLVTISVIAVLVALVMPSLAGIREATRKVVCSSNQRQIGIGVALYADDYRGALPPSVFAAKGKHDPSARPANMMTLRRQGMAPGWDGIGFLYSSDYLPASGVFYCPSHIGEHPLPRYAGNYGMASAAVVGNFHYRGTSNDGVAVLAALPQDLALLADGLETVSDFNHRVGANTLTPDLAVLWVPDRGGAILRALAVVASDPVADGKVKEAWKLLDYGLDPAEKDRDAAENGYD